MADRPWKKKRPSQTRGPRWAALRRIVLNRDGFRCQVCLRAGRERLATEVDHIIPRAEGGPTWHAGNLQAICAPCHRAKSAQEAARGRARARAARQSEDD